MPYGVFSRRLAGPIGITTTPTVILFTVPAGRVYVVKELICFNLSATVPIKIRVGIGSLATSANTLWLLPVAVNSSISWETRTALVAGETLRAHAVDAAATSLTVNGYDLTA